MNLVVERFPVDLQQQGGSCFVSVHTLQRFHDDLFFLIRFPQQGYFRLFSLSVFFRLKQADSPG